MGLFNIADEVGATYRADVNLALAALAGGNTAWTRAATTTLGTTTNGTLSDTSATITAFNGDAGVIYHVRCLGAGSITHHATNLIITQGLADITTAAGDTFDVEMLTATTSRVKNYIFANVQAYSNVTASRVINTNYTNTTGRTIAVSVWGTGDTSGFSGFDGQVGGSTIALGSLAKSAGLDSSVYFLVPAGAIYKVISNSGTSTITNWFELR